MNVQKVKKYLNSDTLKRKKQDLLIDPSTGVYTKISIFLESLKLVELPEIFLL